MDKKLTICMRSFLLLCYTLFLSKITEVQLTIFYIDRNFVGTCSQLQGDPTGVNSDVNRVLVQDGKSSVNLTSHGHCAVVFIGI